MLDNQSPTREIRDGVIKDRSWGRDRGKPIWYFEIVFDGDQESRIYTPGHIAAGIEAAQSN
ncbi:hypothetical protein [Streptomyces sp. NPDC047972]|uniref:hypothetical protein n=1 Tax=Streptomyces sp. NPDC047972 TaxID=3365493 RepID=UPI003721D741